MTAVDNTPQNPTTGPTSTSWWLSVAGGLTALVPFIWTQITHQAPSTQQVTAIVAVVGVLVSLVTKVWHDVSRHKIAASLASVTGEGESLIPMLQSLSHEVGLLRGQVTTGGTAPPAPVPAPPA